MNLLKILITVTAALIVSGCTSVASRAPNEMVECPARQQPLCTGATASRIKKVGKDPNAVCTCVPRN